MIELHDLDGLVCAPGDPMGEIIRRITELGAPKTFQLVADPAGRLIGTVTDGDIRRGPAARCVARHPDCGDHAPPAGNRAHR